MWGSKLRRRDFEGGKERSCVFPRADYTKIRRANFPLAPSVCWIQFDFVTSVSQHREIPPHSFPVGVKRDGSLEETLFHLQKPLLCNNSTDSWVVPPSDSLLCWLSPVVRALAFRMMVFILDWGRPPSKHAYLLLMSSKHKVHERLMGVLSSQAFGLKSSVQ